MNQPFWPRRSPHFATLRVAVRPFIKQLAGQDFAVGLSGGPDSLALAAAVAAERGDSHALAVCVDHGLQPGSREVSEHAAGIARQWGLSARVVSVTTRRSEAHARVARYQALAALGLPVMVAHTAEDQAETLLLSALRGQATGMGPYSVVQGAEVIRPLLGVRRADTVGACAELGLHPWQDPHNQLQEFRRVRIRREVLPLLADIIGGPARPGDAVAPLAQAANDLAQDQLFLDTPASNDCAELALLPAARRRRAVRAWLREQGVDVSRDSLEKIDNLLIDWHGQGPVAVKSLLQPRVRLEVARQGGKLALLPGKKDL